MDNQLLRKKIRLVWTVILLAILIVFLLTGCKPKQIIQERTVTKVDSTAIVSLKSELQKKTIEAEMLKTDLERFREENIRLRSDVSKHEIKYDTSAPLKPDGQYPIASETKTQTKSLLEKEIRENEVLIAEYRKEVEDLSVKNSNLDLMVKSLKEENKELESKITPTTGFNFKLFLAGISTGMILVIVLGLFTKLK